jgi:uncharacterized membrane protein
VTYDEIISDVVRVVEGVGCAVMVLGAVWALGQFAIAAFTGRAGGETAERGYATLRRNLGRVILLGLEILIIADIVRTVIVDPSIESVVVLGLIVVIRIVLSFSLEVEIDGAWPWSRWRLTAASSDEAATGPGRAGARTSSSVRRDP